MKCDLNLRDLKSSLSHDTPAKHLLITASGYQYHLCNECVDYYREKYPDEKISLMPIEGEEGSMQKTMSEKEEAVESYAPRLRVEVVRDSDFKVPTQKVESPETAAEIMKLHLGRVADEHLVTILLDNHNTLIGTITVSSGTINTCMASVKNVLRPAILHNAVGIIVGHNHPSGNPEPSKQDLFFFKQLKQVAEQMDVKILDCIIIGDGSDKIYSHRRSTFD